MQIRYSLKALLAIGAIVCSSWTTAVAEHRSSRGQGQHDGKPPSENAVTHWNSIALEVLPQDPGLVLDSRPFAIMHAAVHDAVNGVERRYEPYAADLSFPGANIDAAVAAASHDVMAALSPSQRDRLDMEYATALAAIPDGPEKDAGIALGQASALANLARRVGDGIDTVAEPVYVPTGQPGDYDFTPPFDQPPNAIALFPGLGRVTPFGIKLEEHRLPGPDPLGSLRYALDLNLVKAIGSLDSRWRSKEQTEIARFWFELSPVGWNRIASTIVRDQKVNVWQAARVLALVNFALADGYIAGFDAKYHFRFWRPYTAIRSTADDGNDFTEPDPAWVPLFFDETYFIPPVPDYPSTHTVLGAAAAEVLIANFGDKLAFKATSGSLPDVTRHFKNFTDAAIENGLSRVYGGIHFLHAVQDGYRQGKGIGRSISQLLPKAR